VLRFAGEELTSHNLPLAFPSNVTVVAATLEITESFGPGRPLGVGAANASIAEATGVRVGPASWAAQKMLLSEAISVEGLALALLGVEPKTELTVQLREDWQNSPAGAVVAEGNIALAQPGERRWRTVRFSQPQTLNTTGYWILAQAASGGAVWLATPGEHPVRVFSGDRTAVEELSVLDGLQVLTYFFSPQVALLGQSPVRLSVGGQIVNSTTSNSDRRQFDIRAALNAVPPDAASPTRTTQLIFLSDLQGSVTVYPPRIEYEVE